MYADDAPNTNVNCNMQTRSMDISAAFAFTNKQYNFIPQTDIHIQNTNFYIELHQYEQYERKVLIHL